MSEVHFLIIIKYMGQWVVRVFWLVCFINVMYPVGFCRGAGFFFRNLNTKIRLIKIIKFVSLNLSQSNLRSLTSKGRPSALLKTFQKCQYCVAE